MNNEEILLEALNTFGNFITVTQEFNENQLEAIYEAMELVKNNAVNSRLSELEEENRLLKLIIENGLGAEDLENDCL
jgi:hypothetical protein